MAGGGKGGSTTTEMKLPEWYTDAAKQALHMGEAVAQRGYVPNYGPQVAAFAPQQVDAMQGANDFSAAFGMGPARHVAAGIPQAETFAGGIRGYSSIPLFDEAMAKYAAANPGQADYSKRFAIDPKTGLLPKDSFWNGWTMSELEKKRLGVAPGTSTTPPVHGGGEGPRGRDGQPRSDYRSPGSPSLWG